MGHRQRPAGVRSPVDERRLVHGGVDVLVLVRDAGILCGRRSVTRVTRDLRRDGFRGGPTNTGNWDSHGTRSDDFRGHEARVETRIEAGPAGYRDRTGGRLGADALHEGAAGRGATD